MKRAIVLFAAIMLLTTMAHALPLAETLPEGLRTAVEEDSLAGGAAWLAQSVRDAAAELLRDGVRDAALLTLAALLCGAVEGIADPAGATRYVSWCGVLVLTTLAAGDLRALIGLGARTVDELGTLSKLLLPTLATAMAAGGFVSAAGVWQVTTLMVCEALTNVVERLLLPLAYCYIAASAAGAMLKESRLDLLADGVKKLVTGGLTALIVAFTGYLALAGVLTGSADRTAVKVTKLAVSGAIPVVGGVLSELTESVLAAAGTLRGTVGVVGVLAIGAVCLVPLLRLGLQFLLYNLAAFAAVLVGTKALGEYLDRLGGAFALVFAMTATCALILLVALLVAATIALS